MTQKFFKLLDRFMEKNRRELFIILLLIAICGSIVGYRYYVYTRDDPQFCLTCHMMQESIVSWQKSRHWNVTCQTCHRMSFLEQNSLLLSYVAKGTTGPVGEKHGREAPWKSCKNCHLEGMAQGSVSVRRSYGHARHIFMENISCDKCHSGKTHTFKPDLNACARCHVGKVVHGVGMEGLACLNCHNYGGPEGGKMVTDERCLKCHTGIRRRGGPMSRLRCFDCHKPHDQIKFTSSDCVRECHAGEVNVGQHRLHMEKARLECLTCHKAHDWVVGKKQARGLCDRCHPLKDPGTFID